MSQNVEQMSKPEAVPERWSGRIKPIEQSRLDKLVELSDLCISAKKIAEALGDGFLAHMLAMTIQAASIAMKARIADRPKP